MQTESHHGLGRFFVDSLAEITDLTQVHQIKQVLRMKPGDRLIVINEGQAFLSRIEALAGDMVRLSTIAKLQSPSTELGFCLKLYLPLLKAQKLELILQKGTELGVSSFQLTELDRCVKQDLNWEAKRIRWTKIIQEAAEQSERLILPPVYPPIGLNDLVPAGDEFCIAYVERLDEYSQGQRSPSPCKVTSLICGPEGGFTGDELALLAQRGVVFRSLGPRILRSETAIIAGISLISCV